MVKLFLSAGQVHWRSTYTAKRYKMLAALKRTAPNVTNFAIATSTSAKQVLWPSRSLASSLIFNRDQLPHGVAFDARLDPKDNPL